MSALRVANDHMSKLNNNKHKKTNNNKKTKRQYPFKTVCGSYCVYKLDDCNQIVLRAKSKEKVEELLFKLLPS